MSDYLVLIFIGAALYAVSAGRRFGHLSAISLFVYAQAAMAVGTLPLLSSSIRADGVHCALIVGSFALFVLTALVFSFVAPGSTRKQYSPEVHYDYPRTAVWLLIAASIGISALYFANVGYIAFFEALRSISQGSTNDVEALRLESYSGSRYLYPGYVNQFKNALLPALAVVVIVAAFKQRSRFRLVIAIIVAPLTLIFLLGTGQRGAFMMSAIMVVVASGLIAPRRIATYVTRAALVVIPLFFLSTLAGGRAGDELRQTENTGEAIAVLFNQLAFRIFGSNQLSSVVGFRYVYDREIGFAGEWAQALMGLLPGQPGSTLSNEIFATLYSSTRGTAPLSLWGSAYYNLSFAGTMAFALVLAISLCAMANAVNGRTATNLIQISGTAGVITCLGMWIADGPTIPLNTGIAVYVLLWFWGWRLEARKRSAGAAHSAPRRDSPAMPTGMVPVSANAHLRGTEPA